MGAVRLRAQRLGWNASNMTAGISPDTIERQDAAFIESLKGGGETGCLIAAHDWSKTSIGAIPSWPAPLRTALNLLLRSPVPIVMLWNEDGVMLYNDAYSVFAGGRHPQLLGSRVREGWPEVADFNDNVMRVGLAGGTLQYKDQQLSLARRGKLEPAWMNLDYSPVLDENGKPAGVIAVVVETTERVLAERRAGEERARLQSMLSQMPGFAAILEGPQHIFTYANQAYSAIAGGRPLDGLAVRDAFPEMAVRGFYDLLDEVYRTGVPYVGRALPIHLDAPANSTFNGDRFIDLLYEPIRDRDGEITGIFVGGYDVTEAQVSAERIGLALDSGAIVGTWIWDIPAGLITGDERFARTFDVDAAALRAGVPVEVLLASIHPEDLSYVVPHLEATLANGGPYSIQYRVRRGAGWTWIEANGRVDKDAEGQSVRFPGVLIDIDERKRVELQLEGARDRLALSEESLRLATDAAEIGTWDLDLKTDLLTWSDRTKAMFGISPDMPCSMADFYAGLHPDDREATGIAFASALNPAVRAVYDVEYRTVGKEDGLIRWVAAKGKGLFNEEGACIRAMGTAIEITARKAADARNALMAELTELMRSGDPAAALDTVCALMGRHFGVSRVGYGLLDPEEDVFRYDVCWTDETVPPLFGEYPAQAFGEQIVARLTAGETIVVDDLFNDALSGSETRTLDTAAQTDTRAILVVPFVRGGRLRTIVYLNAQRPRAWSADEVAFMEAVAERTRQLIDRAETAAALAAREAEFRTVTQAMPNHVWTAGADGRVDWFNDQGYAYAGAPAGSLAEGGWADMVHPDDLAAAAAAWAETLASGGTFEAEIRLRRADGVYRWHIARALAVRDAAGRITRWIGTNTDVEDQKAAIEALDQMAASLKRQVEEELAERERLWDLSQDPFLIADAAGVWERVSPAWTSLLGWTEAELLGRSADWMTHPDDLEKTREEIVGLADGRRTIRFENRLRARDDSYRTFSWNAVEEGGHIYCTARDITDIRARERALRDQQDFTRLALGAVGGVGIWHYSVAGDRFFFDEGIAELYALDPADGPGGLLRADFLGNVHPDDHAGLHDALSGGLMNAGDIELEYRIVHPDGSVRWVLSRGNTYFGDDGQPLRRTGVGIDITEKRRLEEQLRQSQKMEAVGQLTGGIAHDFNNMLAVVMGSLELLDRRLSHEDPRARHYVQQAADASRRAANLTQRLLVFSRQQPLKPEIVDANRLVAGMSDLLRHSIGAVVRLETVLAAGTWCIEVDPNQLENVILNLSVNARDAMPDGGRLTIETQNVHLDARYVSGEMGVPAGQYVMIAVSDTGAGMTADVLTKAFDPFFTTKEPGKGTGLGLSQVYGFVKSSGGHIKIYSEAGGGTTVKIYLPRAEAPGDESETGPTRAAPLPGDPHEIVLVVDDEEAVRRFTVEALSELGYHVLEAATARAALELLARRPEIVLLITDVVMPDIDGRKLADQANAVRPDLKVLFMTGYTRNAVVHNGVLDKGVHMIGKPFTLDDLAARVRGLLDKVQP